MFKWIFLYLSNSRLLPLVLLLGTTEKSLALSSSLPHQIFICIDTITPAKQSHPLHLYQVLQILIYLCGPSSMSMSPF